MLGIGIANDRVGKVNEIPGMSGRSGNPGKLGNGGKLNGIEGIGIAKLIVGNVIPGMSGSPGSVGSGGIENGIEGIGIANERIGGIGILHFVAMSQDIQTFSDNSLYRTSGGTAPGAVRPIGIGIVC